MIYLAKNKLKGVKLKFGEVNILKEERQEFMNTNTTITAVTNPVGKGVGTIPAPEMTHAVAEERAEHIGSKYRVPVSEHAAGVCFDGRGCEHCLNGNAPEIGPKTGGGPLITAYAAARLTGWFNQFEEMREADDEAQLDFLAERLTVNGIVLGGHCATSALAKNFDEGKTGCGANDEFAKIMGNINKASQFVLGNSEALIAQTDTYRPDIAQEAVHAAASPVINWAPVTAMGKLGKDRVEILEGSHSEIMLIVNYKENTTIDRDAVLADEGVQVFALDMWYLDKIANAMTSGPMQKEQFAHLKHAMVAFNVSTLYTLGDGSHRVAIAA